MDPNVSGSEEFVVHTDRAAINRLYGLILALYGAAIIVLLAAIAAEVLLPVWLDGPDLGASMSLFVLPLLVLLVLMMTLVTTWAYLYGARVALGEPLRLDHRGFVMTTAAGRMEIPWEAVTGVRTQRRMWNRILVLHLHPEAGPGSPGVRTDISSRYWARMKRLGGPMLGGTGIRESFPEIQQAVGYFSRGRVPIS